MAPPLEVFCCYAREDQMMLEQLKKHLTLLQRQDQITIWSETDLNAGVEWEKELHRHLESANIILLLISPDFMVSNYCYSIEMQRALERHKAGDVHVIPIILRPVDCEGAPFSKLQRLPTEGNALTGWQDRDEAFANIAYEIKKIVEELQNVNSRQVQLPISVEFDPYVEIHSFTVVKSDFSDLRLSEDNYAWNPKFRRYAVTDGISSSLFSGKWGKIVATSFVERENDFRDEAELVQWLTLCSDKWQKEVGNISLLSPTARDHVLRHGGSQTGFIGCSLLPRLPSLGRPATVRVTGIGNDASFFLVRPPIHQQEQWLIKRFPEIEIQYQSPTIGTSHRSILNTWKHIKVQEYAVQSGDSIILTTFPLNAWIVEQMSAGNNIWSDILTITHDRIFSSFIEQKRSNFQIRDEDTTIIHISIK